MDELTLSLIHRLIRACDDLLEKHCGAHIICTAVCVHEGERVIKTLVLPADQKDDPIATGMSGLMDITYGPASITRIHK